MIEEEVGVMGNEVRAVLSSFTDSTFEEFSNLGLLVDGGSDGDLGGNSGLQRRT